MSGGLEIVVFFVSSMATSCLVGWCTGKTGSDELIRRRLRAVLVTVALYFSVVPLVPVTVSAIFTGGAENLGHFLNMWTAALFIVLGGIMIGSVIVWAILVLSVLFCLATLSMSSRISGNGDIISERQSLRLAKQEEFLWNVEEKSAQQKGGQ